MNPLVMVQVQLQAGAFKRARRERLIWACVAIAFAAACVFLLSITAIVILTGAGDRS